MGIKTYKWPGFFDYASVETCQWQVFTIFAANTGSGSEGVATESKISDPCTMSGWKDYFRKDSTEFAGTVWSDKSVFTDTGSFQSALRAENSSYRASISMQDEANNFLVALSTMASNKEVVGYSTNTDAYETG